MGSRELEEYADILHMSRPTSKKHPQMSIADRAAQFAPFAALSGHKEAVIETGRIPGEQKILDENLKELLDAAIQEIMLKIKSKPKVKVLYFQQDSEKDGGEYISVVNHIKIYDEYTKSLVFVDGLKIAIVDIYDIYEIA